MPAFECRNCEAPRSAGRQGGLCFPCWHWFEYGREMGDGNRIGSGAAQASIRASDQQQDADVNAAEHMTHIPDRGGHRDG